MKLEKLYVITLLLLILAVSTHVAYAQQPSRVLKFEYSTLTVYRGYQWIEVKAYFEGKPTVTTAVAKVIAGVVITTNLSVVDLYSPTTIQVGNVTYSVTRIAIGRVPIPESASTGKALLEVEIVGKDFRNATRVTLTILDHRPVNNLRNNVYLKLERVKTLVLIAGSLGVNVTELSKSLSELEAKVEDATNSLELLGEVDKAVETYNYVLTKLSEIESKTLAELAITNARTQESIIAVAKGLQEYSLVVSKSIDLLSTDFNNKLKALSDKISADTTTSLQTLAKSVSELDANLAKLSQNQADLTKKVSEVINASQIGMAVIALMLVLSSALTIITIRKAK